MFTYLWTKRFTGFSLFSFFFSFLRLDSSSQNLLRSPSGLRWIILAIAIRFISSQQHHGLMPKTLLNFIRPSQRLRRILFKIFWGWNTWKTDVENEKNKKKKKKTCSDSLPSWILQALRLLTLACLLKSEIGHWWSTRIIFPFSFISTNLEKKKFSSKKIKLRTLRSTKQVSSICWMTQVTSSVCFCRNWNCRKFHLAMFSSLK